MRKLWGSIWEIGEVVLISFITVFIIRQFIVQPFLVSGASMEPNFQNGNYLVVDIVSYHFENPSRGDVIVLHYPGNRALFYIKRIVGLPGDKIDITGGHMFINGTELDEKYLPGTTVTDAFTKPEFILGSDQYFVMGDNRAASFDSRSWGPLEKNDIVGVVRFRVWPPFEVFTGKN